MKKILVLSLLLAIPLLGQDATDSTTPVLLENPDMADGTTHWHGNAKLVGSDSNTDLTTGQAAGKGIQVDLKPSSWATVSQQIHGLKPHALGRGYLIPPVQLTIVYQTSPDFTLSTRDTDYTDIGANIGFEKAKINAHPGQLLAFVDYPVTTLRSTGLPMESERLAAAYITPKTDQQPQTFTTTLTFTGAQDTSNLQFCLAFPPGTGSVTLTKISMTELPPKSQP